MNKRIKELALQSDWKSDRLTAANAEEQDRKLQKFAELIIRECADTVLGHRNQFGDSAHAVIKEHFGVVNL